MLTDPLADGWSTGATDSTALRGWVRLQLELQPAGQLTHALLKRVGGLAQRRRALRRHPAGGAQPRPPGRRSPDCALYRHRSQLRASPPGWLFFYGVLAARSASSSTMAQSS